MRPSTIKTMITRTTMDQDLVHKPLLVINNLAVRKAIIQGTNTETNGVACRQWKCQWITCVYSVSLNTFECIICIKTLSGYKSKGGVLNLCL